MKIGGSTLDGISLGKGKIRLKLVFKDNSENLILNLQNVFYLPNSPCNLLSLGFLNNSDIYHENKNETFYKIYSKQINTCIGTMLEEQQSAEAFKPL